MSAMGVKIDQFNVPVCNAFEAKIMNDQLCYEVDLERFSDENEIENELGNPSKKKKNLVEKNMV